MFALTTSLSSNSWCFFVLSCKQWSTIESTIEIWFSGDSTKTVGLHCNLRSILIGQRIQERSWLGEKDMCWRLRPLWIISRLRQSQLTTTTIYIRHSQFSFSDQYFPKEPSTNRMTFALSRLGSHLGELYKTRDETGDFELRCQGKVIKVHSLILSMR